MKLKQSQTPNVLDVDSSTLSNGKAGWEPGQNLKNSATIVADFHCRNPDKPGPEQSLLALDMTKSSNILKTTFNHALFPANFFVQHGRPPLTNAIDDTLPTKRDLNHLVVQLRP